MTSTILFLCPHHAAKSVIAEAYFTRLAKQYDLPLRGDSAGTDPAEAVSPAVVDLLRSEGIDVSGRQPRHVTESELSQAQRIISMGCTSEELGVASERIEQWADVPMVSQDIFAARDAIRAHVESLVTQLRDVSIVGDER
jgi:arsenate reductase